MVKLFKYFSYCLILFVIIGSNCQRTNNFERYFKMQEVTGGPADEQTTFLSDTDGAISKLIFTLNEGTLKGKEDLGIEKILISFLSQKRWGIEVTIFAAKSDSIELSKLNLDSLYDNVFITYLEESRSKWIQDELLVLESNENKKYLLSSNSDDTSKVKLISKHFGYQFYWIDHTLDGGNVLKFGNKLWIGKNHVKRKPENRDLLCNLYRNELAPLENLVSPENIKFIGDEVKCPCSPDKASCQNTFLFHLDLHILPINSNTVFLGIPTKVNKANCNFGNGITYESVKSYVEQLYKSIERISNVKIVKVPIPYSCRGNNGNGYWGYYTNSLIDNYNGKTTLYMPSYSDTAFHKSEDEFFNTASLHVDTIIKVSNFSELSKKGHGVLRCFSKVVDRD